MSGRMMKKTAKRFVAGAAVLMIIGIFSGSDMVYAAQQDTTGNTASEGKQQITGFVGLSESQSRIDISGRVSEELLTARMPASIDVYLDGADEPTAIPVTWNPVGDYENTHYYYYEFDPQWDTQKYTIDGQLLDIVPYVGVFITSGVSSSFKMSSGSSNESTIYKFLKNEMGLNTAAACGVLANIQSESSFNPTASIIDTNDKISYGICQWNGPRFDLLKEYCSNRGYDYKTLTGQLNYLKYELETTEKSAFAKIKDVENTKAGAGTAGYNWARYFERCASVYFDARKKLAEDTYWKKYGDGSGDVEPVNKKYSITYYLYEGENNSSNPKSFYATTDTITLKNPTKKGYTFKGWYKDSSLSKQITTIEKGTKGDIKLYAKWQVNKYTIRFNGNKSTSGTMADMTSREYDMTYKLRSNTYERKGYKFTGWDTKPDGSGKSYANKEEIENLSSKNGAVITLYAQWSKQVYTITYKVNGGKLASGSTEKYAVNSKTFTLKNPTRTGYTFLGWYKQKSFKTKVTQIKKGSVGNITLYAKWKLNKYQVAYKGNGSTSGTMKNVSTYNYGNSYTLAANKFKRTGYTFTGWNTKADGSGTSYQNKEEVRNLSKKNNKTITLYAQWEKKQYTIKYELNGGTVVKSNKRTYYYDTKTFKFSAPVREGYTFKGWYTESNFKNKITQVKKGTRKNYKLYAKWSLNKYNIQFKGNGSTSGKMTAMESCKYDREYTLPANGFKKKGYIFIGWSTSADGSDTFYGNQAKVSNLAVKNGDTVTLYAQWEAE